MSTLQGHQQCELFYKEKLFGKKFIEDHLPPQRQKLSLHLSQHGSRECREQVPRVIGIRTRGTDAETLKVQRVVQCSEILQPITSKQSKVKRGKHESTITEDYLTRTLNFSAFPWCSVTLT